MADSRKRWAIAFLAATLMLTVVLRRSGCGRRQRSAPAAAPGEVGARVGDFRFTEISGREVSFEQLQGKVLLVDFWATWCAPCKVEMPGFQDLQTRYGNRGLVVIGIALDGDAGAVMHFAKELGVRYTLALSTPELQERFGGILGLPTTILVDRQGIIRKKVVGFEYKEAFETSLEEIL